ncbi:MAG: hypothetical protein ABSC42_17435 [Tepidisphaeraceae bacterium]
MDVPKDLGQRIVEATRLAVALHFQRSPRTNFLSIGGADRVGGAVTDGGLRSLPQPTPLGAGALAESEAA